MAKVLKYKYFPLTDIFQAVSKPRDSWLWKSWDAAKELIRDGSIWKVGNGRSIRVWEDCWLATGQWQKPLSPKPEGCIVMKVKDLLNQSGEGWNSLLIYSLFTENEAQVIINIPVSSMGAQDRLVWGSTTNRQYSKNSGYKRAKTKLQHEQKRAKTSRSRGEEEGKVWELDIKRKIQIFLACHDRLPVGMNLNKREMKVDEVCKMCREDVKTVEHVFFHCRKAKLICQLSPVRWDGMDAATNSFRDW